MDIVITFKESLFTQKNPPSAITIKNYLSDVRKFITWYESTFNEPFIPEVITKKIISQYDTQLHSSSLSLTPAASSSKRYISSLRRFVAFLKDSGAIFSNPFDVEQHQPKNEDPFLLKEFKNFLYLENASKLTIKNYIVDIKQFLDWLGKVTNESEANSMELLKHIDNYALEQYKQRLYGEAKLSPVSINRKLSSLRKYTRWLGEKGIITIASAVATPAITKPQKEAYKAPAVVPVIKELPLTALQGISEEKEEKKTRAYSSFAPIRLVQKTTKIITLGSDLLFFNPIAKSFEAIHYLLWKRQKRTIFAPVSTILKASSYVPSVSIKTIIPKQASIQAPRSANIMAVVEKVRKFGETRNPDTVHNFTKALYAPLSISTKHMHWKEKLLHTVRYVRPYWYIKYHSFGFVNYVHYAVLLIATMISGSLIYQTWLGAPEIRSQAVLAAQTVSPPRTLSFHGRLLDKTNTPITAETPLRFTLYNNPTATGAAQLWQEKQAIKPDHNGYFTATLGKVLRLDQSLFTDNADLYLGLTIGDNQELFPRQQIPTTNYAANARTVEGLKPITDTPDIAQNVLLALDSSGNLTIGGTESHTFQATGGQLSVSGQTLLLTTNPGSNGDIKIVPDGSGIIDLQKPIQNTSNYSTSDGVPGSVEVRDMLSILATESSHSALFVNQNGTGDIISGRSNGIAKFSLDRMGNAFFAGSIITNSDTIGTTSNTFDIGGSNVKNLTLGENATVLSLGGIAGVTSINKSISIYGPSVKGGPMVNVLGNLTASEGITVPKGQQVVLNNLTPGSIPFVNDLHQLIENPTHFTWDDKDTALKVLGSLCVNSITGGTCNTTPGTITTKTLNTVGTADLAENYVSSQTLEPGDVVIMEGQGNTMAIVKSTAPYQHQLIGIVSTNPGVTLNSDATTDSQHPHIYPLALQGRVPVKVSSSNGPIQAGDDLTSSSLPGVAMKATASGQIIGKAFESYTNADPNAVGEIMAFVNLSYLPNPATLADNGNLTAATESATLEANAAQDASPSAIMQTITDATSTVNAAFIHARILTTQSLQVIDDNIIINGQTFKAYITTLVRQLIDEELTKRFAQVPQTKPNETPVSSSSAQTTDQTASISAVQTLIGSSSALLQPDALASISATTQIQGLTPFALYTNSITNNTASLSAIASSSAIPTQTLTASDSGAINPIFSLPNASQTTIPSTPKSDIININSIHYAPVASLSGQLTYVPNFTSDFATFNQGLIALGPTSLTEVAVSSTISVNNNLRITNNSLDTLGSDLNVQPLRQGNIRFMGGLVAIDTEGNLTVNGSANFAQDVTVHGQFAAGIIAPIPNQDLVINLKDKANKTGSSLLITNATGSGVLNINQSGDVASSGTANFSTIASHGFSIIRGAQADTSITQTTADSSAGKGIITAHQTERTIITPFVTSHSLIYITATSNTGTSMPYLARQTAEDSNAGTKGSFTVAIPTQITKDISFNWWIVN